MLAGVSDKARRLLFSTAGVVVAWFLCVLFFWALRPLHDVVPVGISADGVHVSQSVTCNTLFQGSARDNTPLPTIVKPLAYPRQPCELVHTQAQQVFVVDVLGALLVLGGLAFVVVRARRLDDRSSVQAASAAVG
ncbi:unannotated protein [freshwater metagenome]|uniref:Unannotated protein n=1 Tax=freshwater metagenome TaxID=449393 RepID=A0A6J7DJ91_9ZZZZ